MISRKQRSLRKYLQNKELERLIFNFRLNALTRAYEALYPKEEAADLLSFLTKNPQTIEKSEYEWSICKEKSGTIILDAE